MALLRVVRLHLALGLLSAAAAGLLEAATIAVALRGSFVVPDPLLQQAVVVLLLHGFGLHFLLAVSYAFLPMFARRRIRSELAGEVVALVWGATLPTMVAGSLLLSLAMPPLYVLVGACLLPLFLLIPLNTVPMAATPGPPTPPHRVAPLLVLAYGCWLVSGCLASAGLLGLTERWHLDAQGTALASLHLFQVGVLVTFVLRISFAHLPQVHRAPPVPLPLQWVVLLGGATGLGLLVIGLATVQVPLRAYGGTLLLGAIWLGVGAQLWMLRNATRGDLLLQRRLLVIGALLLLAGTFLGATAAGHPQLWWYRMGHLRLNLFGWLQATIAAMALTLLPNAALFDRRRVHLLSALLVSAVVADSMWWFVQGEPAVLRHALAPLALVAMVLLPTIPPLLALLLRPSFQRGLRPRRTWVL